MIIIIIIMIYTFYNIVEKISELRNKTMVRLSVAENLRNNVASHTTHTFQ